MSEVISDEKYKEKKARLVNKKFELQAKGSRDGEWLERYKTVITFAHQASYIAAEANFETQRDFLKRLGSNFRLYNSTLLVSYTSVFKIFAEKQKYNWGPSRMSRGGTSRYILGMYYSEITDKNKQISDFREVYS